MATVGDAKENWLTRAVADLRISCTGFESWTRRWIRRWTSLSDLPDDVLVDILSRLPIKSLCRCKLVSTRWGNLISHPEHRKKLPQTLAGFFFNNYPKLLAPHFTTFSRAADPFIDPSLSFLPKYERIEIKDSCNGLLLCRCWKKSNDPMRMESVVCNPATEKWVFVPDSGWSSKVSITRLGFDPAVSSHFHVFEFIPDYIWNQEIRKGSIQVVAVYSSKTRVWSFNKNENLPIPVDKFTMPQESKAVFFNGILHLTTFWGMVLAIDVEGKVLRGISCHALRNSKDDPLHVYLSQGHLYLASNVFNEESGDHRLSVWVLEDYNSENWTLKHNMSLRLVGAGYCSKFRGAFKVITIHPEHDMIFMVCGRKNKLMSYEMDHRRLRFISQLGQYDWTPYIPYIPLFSESLADDEQ